MWSYDNTCQVLGPLIPSFDASSGSSVTGTLTNHEV